MFIAHGEKVRKYSRWILAAILVLLVPGFVALFSTTGAARRRAGEIPSIGGKELNPAEYLAARRDVLDQVILNTGQPLRNTPEVEQQLVQDAVLRILLKRQAQALGIRVSDEALVGMIRAQPLFRGEQGQFDPERYRQYLAFLNHHGINEQRFEQLMRYQALLAQLRQLVGAAAQVSSQEVAAAFHMMHEQFTIAYAELTLDQHATPVEVTEADAQEYFENNRESFREPEKVKVRYVHVSRAAARNAVRLTDEEVADYYELNKNRYRTEDGEIPALSNVVDKVREELTELRAERLAADQATELTVKLVFEPGAPRPDFAQAAAAAGLTVVETDFFSLREPPAEIKAGPQLGYALAALTEDVPFSDPVAGEDGYYVFELLGRQPSVIPSFAEAKPRVIEQLSRLRQYDGLIQRGEELAAEVARAVAAGETFAAACAKHNLTVKTPAPLRLGAELPELPAARSILQQVVHMNVGDVSPLLPTSNGAVFFQLQQRTPPSDEDAAREWPVIARQLLERKRDALFEDWVRSVWNEANVRLPRVARPATDETTAGPGAG